MCEFRLPELAVGVVFCPPFFEYFLLPKAMPVSLPPPLRSCNLVAARVVDSFRIVLGSRLCKTMAF